MPTLQVVRALLLSFALALAAAGVSAAADSAAKTPEISDRIDALLEGEQLEDAEALARQHLAAVLAQHDPASLETARAQALVIRVLLEDGDSDQEELRTLADASLQGRRDHLPENDLEIVEALKAKQAVLARERDYPGILEVLLEVLAIQEAALGPDHGEVGATLGRIAVTEDWLGMWIEARRHFERALAIEERVYGPESAEVSKTLVGLGLFELMNGDYPTARASLGRAVANLEKLHGREDARTALPASYMALVDIADGDTEAAIERLEYAIPILEKEYGPESYEVAFSVGSLAEAYLKEGRVDEAYETTLRARSLTEALWGPDEAEMADYDLFLGAIHGLRGEYEQADEAYRSALAIRTAIFGEESPKTADVRYQYAHMLNKAGRVDECAELASRAQEIVLADLVRTIRVLPERKALRYSAHHPPALDLLLSLTADAPDRTHFTVIAWDALMRTRGVILDELAARLRAARLAEAPEIAVLLEEYRAALENLSAELANGPAGRETEEFAAGVTAARADIESIERRLADASETFRADQVRGLPGLTEVTDHLPAGSALVAFARYAQGGGENSRGAFESDSRFVAFVLPSGGGDPITVPIGSASGVDALVSAWRETLASGQSESANRAAGRALRERIFDPVAEHLDEPEVILVVPDGSLNLVSFAALPDGEAGYLVERSAAFHYLSAERDLVPLANASVPGNGLLALGGADYDLDPAASRESDAMVFRGSLPDCAEFAEYRFEALPATEEEVADIVGIWGDSRDEPAVALRGASATVAEVARGAVGRRVVHLATHGFFLSGECASVEPGTRGVTGTAPLGETAAEETEIEEPGAAPLTLSGLALAGANHRSAAPQGGDDGLLTSQEISTLDLAGVEWAVLSACDTGVGRIEAGEGVFGLRRAFEVAGAETLILSLWPVEDEAARTWMRSLYRIRFQDGRTTAESVQAATLALLQERRASGSGSHPFGWAAFVAAGDWR